MERFEKITTTYHKQHHAKTNESGRPYLSFSIDCILGNSFGRKQDVDEVDYEKEQCIRTYELNHSSCTCNDCAYLQSDTIRFEKERTDFTAYPSFDWLQCTRYKPPKVTRAKRKRTSLARSSRQPRIPFTPYQQATLEHAFQKNQYLTTQLLNEISSRLHLSKERIKIWYQNRRARDRREEQTKTDVNQSMIYVK